MTGALADSNFLAVVERAVVEGIFGETSAALEAAWAREAAEDETVRAVLTTIAEDESRHAALAFRFVAWAAARDPRVMPLVEHQLAEARARAERDPMPDTDGSIALRTHGVLDASTRRAALVATLDAIVPGALEALRAQLESRHPGVVRRNQRVGRSVSWRT
jgi:hypothetical protein